MTVPQLQELLNVTSSNHWTHRIYQILYSYLTINLCNLIMNMYPSFPSQPTMNRRLAFKMRKLERASQFPAPLSLFNGDLVNAALQAGAGGFKRSCYYGVA